MQLLYTNSLDVFLNIMQALDWLISYYWEPQEKAIPVQNNKTANLRKEIKSSLREVSLCLKAKQMSKLSSAHVKGKREYSIYALSNSGAVDYIHHSRILVSNTIRVPSCQLMTSCCIRSDLKTNVQVLSQRNSCLRVVSFYFLQLGSHRMPTLQVKFSRKHYDKRIWSRFFSLLE